MLVLCLIPLWVSAQDTASNFINKLVDIEIELQANYLYTEFELLRIQYPDIANTQENYQKLAKIIIVHQLFATDGPYNGSMLIGDIPYLSNFTDSNPRYNITKDGKLIKDITSKNGITLANIDRTPDIFLPDFFSSTKYSHPDYGEFSTFGWCSEREMSYAVVMKALGFSTYIEAPGAHAWTNVSVSFTGKNSGAIIYQAHVDNTFNDLYWETYIPPVGYSTKLEAWYNKQVSRYDGILNNVWVAPGRKREIKSLYSIYNK